MTLTDRTAEVKQAGENLFAQQPDWITFYREIFGLRGFVRQAFPNREMLAQFQQSDAYSELQQMLAKLREQGPIPTENAEPTRAITVRLPKSLHDALRVEAHECRTSMNKLCISKLLQLIEDQWVPADLPLTDYIGRP
jgi:predicted HicB family RNase H-like nuclease